MIFWIAQMNPVPQFRTRSAVPEAWRSAIRYWQRSIVGVEQSRDVHPRNEKKDVSR